MARAMVVLVACGFVVLNCRLTPRHAKPPSNTSIEQQLLGRDGAAELARLDAELVQLVAGEEWLEAWRQAALAAERTRLEVHALQFGDESFRNSRRPALNFAPWRPEYSCAAERRVEGKWLCGPEAHQHPCTILSLGPLFDATLTGCVAKNVTSLDARSNNVSQLAILNVPNNEYALVKDIADLCRAGALHVDQLTVRARVTNALALSDVYALFANARACRLMLHHKSHVNNCAGRGVCADFSWVSFRHAKRAGGGIPHNVSTPRPPPHKLQHHALHQNRTFPLPSISQGAPRPRAITTDVLVPTLPRRK